LDISENTLLDNSFGSGSRHAMFGGTVVVSQGSDRILGVRAPRRTVLKGATGAAAGFAAFGVTGKSYQRALAQDSVRAQILAIPGVGAGQPTDTDMAKVGELCLEPTKANVQPGEFNGVQLRFLGLNNQNLHNFVFRAFLQSWEEYTGASIEWIDLAQADYNARLQQSIATGTVDFDVTEMGAPFEGDVLGKSLASEMPDWVKQQIDMTDYVGYLQPPVGTWGGKTYRVSIDGDCHNFNFRTDVFSDPDLAAA
jgi:multiple sugar transport system substrate-binding protein